MVQFRHYSMDGILQRAALTSPTGLGAICYIGGSKFAMCSGGAVEIFQYDGDGITLDRQLFAFTGGAPIRVGAGVESDGAGHLMVASRFDIGTAPFNTRTYAVASYSIDTGTQDMPERSLSVSLAEGGLAYDGIHWWLGFTSASVPKFYSLEQTEISGTSATVNDSRFLEDALPTAAVAKATDLCWDGQHLWTLQGSVVVGYTMDAKAAATEAARFTLAAGSPHTGIATDGTDLFIMSRN